MQTPQPFQPGDRVVRIGESIPYGGPQRGESYTVDSLEWCCGERGWKIHLAEVSFREWILFLESRGFRWEGCGSCKSFTQGWDAKHFRKLDDMFNVDALLEEVSVKKPVLI